jgi:hypothetical protein
MDDILQSRAGPDMWDILAVLLTAYASGLAGLAGLRGYPE